MIYQGEYRLHGEQYSYPPMEVFLLEAETPEQAQAASHLIAQEGVEDDEHASVYSLGNVEPLEEEWNEHMLKPYSAQEVIERHTP